MDNPVDMPNGGMMIFLMETADRPSRTRHVTTAARPASDPTIDIPLGSCNIAVMLWFGLAALSRIPT
jgi:hypothetical protein